MRYVALNRFVLIKTFWQEVKLTRSSWQCDEYLMNVLGAESAWLPNDDLRAIKPRHVFPHI
jgi:hypothetical protein